MKQNKIGSRHKGILLLIAFSLGWALKDVFIKKNLSQLDPLVVTFIISLTALSSALLIKFIRSPSSVVYVSLFGNLANSSYALSLALFTAIAITASIYAINLVGPVVFTITDGIIYPVSLLVLSILLLQERVQKSTVIGLLIATIGVFSFYSSDTSIDFQTKLGGGLLAIISSLAYAVSLVLIKRLFKNGFCTNDILVMRFSIIGAISIPGLILMSLSIDPISLAYLLFVGSIGYVGLMTILFEGLKNVPANLVSIFIAASPLFSSVITWLLIPNTTYSLWQIFSLLIIFVGFLLPVLQFDKDHRSA